MAKCHLCRRGTQSYINGWFRCSRRKGKLVNPNKVICKQEVPYEKSKEMAVTSLE